MSDNEFDDTSFLDGERRKAKTKQYIQNKRIQFGCSQSTAVVMGVLTLIAIVATAAISAYFYPFCHCQPHNNTAPQGEIVIRNATKDSDSPWKKIRLPDTIMPISYHIELRVNISKSYFIGHVDITVEVAKETDLIVFHAFERLSIRNVRVLRHESGVDVPIKEIVFMKKYSVLCLVLHSSVSTHEKLTIHVYYESVLGTDLDGLYKSTYKTKSGQTRALAVTHFEPTRARKAFPCFDEPALKARFRLSVQHDPEYTSLSNMPVANSVTEADGTVTDHFQESVKMSTYLVAALVSDYDHVQSVTPDGVKIRVNAPPEYKDDLALALAAAANITQFYATFFNTKFPLPKQDLVAVPDFEAGAMENWGMITYRMIAILYNNFNSDSHKRYVITVIAHELAHQWFGNLVTMKWWNDLWLNEGFASYVEYLGTQNFNPEYRMMETFLWQDLVKGLELDALEHSHPISVEVKDPAQINSLFDRISYSKGASIIRMLSSILGHKVFEKGLKSYLDMYKYSNARSDDLWEELRKASQVSGTERDVKALMDTWTLHMGYPLVTVTRDGAEITASQKRFLISGSKDVDHTWITPITYATDVDTKHVTKSLLKTSKRPIQAKFPIDASAKWVKVNWGYEGFFRVNYDDANWNALIKQLENHEVFSPFDRTNLIGDIFSLAWSGDNTFERALNASLYLSKERSFTPWNIAHGHLLSIKFRLAQSPVLDKWKKYLLSLVKDPLTQLQFSDTGTLDQKELRSMLWLSAAELGYQPAITSAMNQFKEFMNHDSPDLSSLNANLKSVILSVGVMSGGKKEWDFCWGLYEKATDPSDLSMLRAALGMTKDQTILEKYLSYTLDPKKIRLQDIGSVIGSVAYNPLGGDLAWNFFTKNYDFLYKHFGVSTFGLSNIVVSVTSPILTQEKLDEAVKFLSTHKLGAAANTAKQAIEKMKIHVEWIAKHETTIDNWLTAHGSHA